MASVCEELRGVAVTLAPREDTDEDTESRLRPLGFGGSAVVNEVSVGGKPKQTAKVFEHGEQIRSKT